MRNLLFWSLFPLALPQALYVRRTAPRFAPPDCAPSGDIGSGPALQLIGIGDSIIAGVGASRLDQALVGQTAAELAARLGRRVGWRTIGRSGARVQHLLEEYADCLPERPADVILVSVGVNDVTGLTPQPVWERRLAVLLDRLRAHSPQAVIGLAGLPPLGRFPLLPEPLRFASGQRARSFDRAARRVASLRDGVVHLPVDFETTAGSFSDDGFHPSESSYAFFGRAMAERLVSELRSRRPNPAPPP